MNRQLLENYYALVTKVDELCSRVSTRLGEHIVCRPGCDGCCRHLTLFPVEAVALATALAEKPEEEIEYMRRLAATAAAGPSCPLLQDGLCLLYEARPIICRTHGLPLLIADGASSKVDFCPQNFVGISSLPGDSVIDLERLNTLLTSINAHFLATINSPLPERLTIANALLLDL